jgi:glucosyl-3-phosphoglycerate synthase
MADFYQHAVLPTFHHLAESDLLAREAELAGWAATRPMALLLPALSSEFTGSALPQMLRQISAVPYVGEVILSVNLASAEQIRLARTQCRELLGDKPFTLLWNDGPELQAMHQRLAESTGVPYRNGKGTNIWTGVAHLLARGEHQLVASHDTDILSYERGLLWRLCYPVAHPDLPYRFAKGYYGRVGERLYGRMTRLLIFPLIQAFIEVAGRSPLLNRLESFRYPLSGEFCADLTTLAALPMPSGWGLEMSLLCASQRLLSNEEICQVDLGLNFEHRHRVVSNAPADAAEGLVDSAIEVTRTMADYVLPDIGPAAIAELLEAVKQVYPAIAGQWVPRYQHDALINGLRYNLDDEQRAVQVFAKALDQSFAGALDPLKVPNCIERPAPASALEIAGIREMLLAAGAA